jgi:hypothetical protein
MIGAAACCCSRSVKLVSNRAVTVTAAAAATALAACSVQCQAWKPGACVHPHLAVKLLARCLDPANLHVAAKHKLKLFLCLPQQRVAVRQHEHAHLVRGAGWWRLPSAAAHAAAAAAVCAAGDAGHRLQCRCCHVAPAAAVVGAAGVPTCCGYWCWRLQRCNEPQTSLRGAVAAAASAVTVRLLISRPQPA